MLDPDAEAAARAKVDAEAKLEAERAERLDALKATRVGAFLDAAFDRMMSRAEGRERPIPTPWPSVNTALGGGLWPGLFILVGNTGSGKSQWALQVAVDAARRGTPVLYIGLELGKVDLVARLAGLVTGRRWSRLFLGNGEDPTTELSQVRKMDAVRELAAMPFHLEMGPPMGWSYDGLAASMATMRELYPELDGPGSRPILVVLDFLQLVSSPEGAREDIRERIGRAAYAGRAVAREYDASVLLVSSTPRENYALLEGREVKGKDGKVVGGPGLGKGNAARLVGLGKESGEVEYAADAVMVLAREEYAPTTGSLCWLAVAKGRAVTPGWTSMAFDGGRWTERDAKPTGRVDL
jgi:replicative DNA helicase